MRSAEPCSPTLSRHPSILAYRMGVRRGAVAVSRLPGAGPPGALSELWHCGMQCRMPRAVRIRAYTYISDVHSVYMYAQCLQTICWQGGKGGWEEGRGPRGQGEWREGGAKCGREAFGVAGQGPINKAVGGEEAAYKRREGRGGGKREGWAVPLVGWGWRGRGVGDVGGGGPRT